MVSTHTVSMILTRELPTLPVDVSVCTFLVEHSRRSAEGPHYHPHTLRPGPRPLTRTLSCKSSPELARVQGLILMEKQHSPLLP